MESLELIEGETTDNLSQGKTCLLNVSIDDYESLPKHMKGLASWEVASIIFSSFLHLSAAVEKMNAYIASNKARRFPPRSN